MFGMWLLEAPYNSIQVRKLHSLDQDEHDDNGGLDTHQFEHLFVPSTLRGGNNVRGDVGNIILRKTSAEGRHGILSVGYLRHDGLLVTSAGEVLLKGGLLKGLIGHDDVLSAGVACGAVGVEDLFSGSDISSEGGGDCNTDSDSGTGNGGLDGLGEV